MEPIVDAAPIIEVVVGSTTITANSATAILEALRSKDWTQFICLEDYKCNLARRLKNYTGIEVDYKAPDLDFLKGLHEAGFIKALYIQPSLFAPILPC